MAAPLNLLQLTNGAKAFGGQKLFEDAVFAVNEGEHIGVIGPNGAGKTTLFKILIQEQELDAGTITRAQSLRLGYLSQHDNWSAEETGNQYLERVSRLPLWQVKSMGRDLQVSEEVLNRPIVSLSGGYRMRIKLIGLLGLDPNLMLLDEPTNYLDLETTLLLERFLQNYDGAFLLISHDREFLRRTTDHIVEVEAGEITKYNGNIDDYFEQKELLRSQLQAAAQNQAEKRKAVLEFVNRFGAKATKAKQAQSRMKALEKMEVIEFKPVPGTAVIQIPQPTHVGKSVMILNSAEFGYGSKKVLRDVSMDIRRGDHVAVVGLNGAGKSTLLKGLAGTLVPLSGSRELGYQVEIAIFNQHVVEVLNPEHTVYESLEDGASPSVTPQEIRNMAGSLLFSSDHISKKVRVLSGGEKSRVALGRILLRKVPCLLLDEPTNHLDFQTVEALTEALKRFSGTLVVVSHDRGFIRRVANKILEVRHGEVLLYPGNYDEYVWSLQKRLAAGEVADEENALEGKAALPKAAGVLNKERTRQLRLLEKKIATCEQAIEKLEKANFQANEKIIAGEGPSTQWVQQMSENTLKLEQLEAEWLELASQKEEFNKERWGS
ncbi:MAG: ABC-F family ATP-binding cassette domain-containing protein [Bdellovibrionales bacterium]